MGHKKAIKIAFAILALNLTPKGALYAHSTWDVLIKILPANIVAREAGLNTSLYVLKQTHEPLFRINDGDNYESRVLNTWSRSVDSSLYTFCPNTSLAFKSGVFFDLPFFHKYLVKVTQSFDPAGKVLVAGDCVHVEFNSPKKRFLEYLTLYENAPAIKQSENIEIGLGSYYAESVSDSEIVLRRKLAIRNGYNTIRMRKYSGPQDENLNNKEIDDFNKIPLAEVPEWVKRGYLHFDEVILKTVALVISHPHKAVREVLYNCVDIDALKKAFYPAFHESSTDIQNVLPLGVRGAQIGRPIQKCVVPNSLDAVSGPIVFLNYGLNNETQMKQFVAAYAKKTRLKILLKGCPAKEAQKILFVSPRGYTLAIIAMDAVRPDYSAFFDYLVREDGFFDFRMPEIKHLYESMMNEDSPDNKNELGGQIAQLIASQHVLLPLFQEQRRLYYPSTIKNLTVGRGFLEYPEVADFRW